MSSRRGAFAGYIEVTHDDFDELADFVKNNPDDSNIGWIIKDSFIEALVKEDAEAIRRWQKMLYVKMIAGKGYFLFIDKVNRKVPLAYKRLGLDVKSSNLCNEILLHSSEDYTYTCILSSMNIYKYDEWKDTDAVFWANIFLDCVVSEFIERAKTIDGLEKAVAMTEKGRAVGLGQCGLASYFQSKRIPFESFEAHQLNKEIAYQIAKQSVEASQDMAKELGEPDWCKGLGLRNTHRIALPPTKSTALLVGGISEGINPDPMMVYTQNTSAGDVDRVNPVLLDLMKERGVYNTETIKDIINKAGSVQHVNWLDEHEKLVFRTAFEMDMQAILRMAAARGQYLCQWQSLNLFFSADETEEYIAKIHKEAFLDENILGLYYIYTQAGVQASKDECIACQ